MEKIIKFGDIETEKQKFHQHKETVSIKNIEKILMKKILIAKILMKKIKKY